MGILPKVQKASAFVQAHIILNYTFAKKYKYFLNTKTRKKLTTPNLTDNFN